MKKPIIITENCIGCGGCVGIEPEVFELPEGAATAIVKDLPDYGIFEDKINDAIGACPGIAIEWSADDVKEETDESDSGDESEAPSDADFDSSPVDSDDSGSTDE